VFSTGPHSPKEPVRNDQPFVDFRPDRDPFDTLMRGVWQPHFSSAYTVTSASPDLVERLYGLAARWADSRVVLVSGGPSQLPQGIRLGESFQVSRSSIAVNGASFRRSTSGTTGVESPEGAFHVLVEHRDRDFPERSWRIVLGGKALPPTDPNGASAVLLSISSSFKDNAPSTVPYPSVPFLSFLREAEARGEFAIYSGQTRLRGNPVVVDSEEAVADLYKALTDETRRHPIVLVSGRGRWHDAMAYDLGLAQVYVEFPLTIGASHGLADILAERRSVPREYLVWGGAIRVYRPGGVFDSPPRAHRYVSGANFNNEEELVQTLRQGCYVLSRHDLSTDKRAPISSEVDIERLRQLDHLDILRARPTEPLGSQSNKALETQVGEWRDMAESFANDNSKLQGELAAAHRRNAELTEKLRSSEWLNEQLREDNVALRQELAHPNAPVESIDPEKLVDGEATLRAIKARFGEKIETTAKFDRSLAEFEPNDKKLFPKIFEAVTDMHEILWREKFERQSGNFFTEFNGQSRFGLTMTESQLTKQKPGLAELRADSHDGESFEAWSHVKYGNKPGEQFRIHFVFFEDTQKIVLSWVGDHMPTSSSGKSGGRRG
jgi:hypothetical protein